MSPTCKAQRDLMVDHLLGELDGLLAARLEAHLDNCAECAEVYQRLQAGFQAARGFEPELDDSELGRLGARLEPYLEPEDERPARFGGLTFWSAALGGAALAAGVLALWVFGPAATTEPGASPASVIAAAPSPPAAPAPRLEGPVRRRALTEHLRAVTSADFAGEVRRPSPKVTELDVEEGFAVLDFEGGEQRILRVSAPDVEVRVIGTRFFVEAAPGAPTAVGVISGRVEVHSRGQVEILGAGRVRAYAQTGAFDPEPAALRARAHAEDEYLDAPEPEPEPEPEPKRASKPRRPRFDPVSALTTAEGLVRAGEIERASRLYDRILAGRPPPAIRDLARYERARLWGFAQGDTARAERAFTALAARGTPEVRRQAALARCELAAKRDACAAQACLRALEAKDGLRAEAQALLHAWGVRGVTCDDHKSATPAQRTQ